ncbi:two-component system OmpR family response regulator [Caulobacter rhizosphaerae]|uniref:Two-component system OmpR family response regulator n=1 Tax=Caulobacter rhizosphaerae TaxID=2010972 RepID=A0ABU1MZY7_9CAUL|nr:response regulator [Caulobacter rhizosphaerae]MDR6531405.1 two-component system OmpR family response regulator [Caulobacter rhizosphaerae]
MQPEARPRRIFIAEDDRSVLELLTTRLGLAGYDTVFGRDGWEALDGIHSAQPAAIILDVNMPRLDGFGVLRHLRKSPRVAHIPVMMLTARNAPGDIKEALTLGAKPFTDAQLLARVTRLLRPRPVSTPANESILL